MSRLTRIVKWQIILEIKNDILINEDKFKPGEQ